MNWKTSFRSIYDDGAPEPDDLALARKQNTYLALPDRAALLTDQCFSSTVRSLADESYNVIVVEDCCAAGSDEPHRKELEIINMIYCHVLSSGELVAAMKLA